MLHDSLANGTMFSTLNLTFSVTAVSSTALIQTASSCACVRETIEYQIPSNYPQYVSTITVHFISSSFAKLYHLYISMTDKGLAGVLLPFSSGDITWDAQRKVAEERLLFNHSAIKTMLESFKHLGLNWREQARVFTSQKHQGSIPTRVKYDDELSLS